MNQIITGVYLSVGLFAGYKLYHLYNKYNNLLNLMNIEGQTNTITLHHTYAVIPYKYNNTEYTVRIPYNVSKVCHMDEFIVWAETPEGSVNITQQPGIPYMLTPTLLGCNSITVHNVDSDKYYDYADVPMYLEDI